MHAESRCRGVSIAQCLDCIHVTHYSEFATKETTTKKNDYVQQTFAQGGPRHQNFTQTLLFRVCKGFSCYQDKDGMKDVTYIRSIPVSDAENSVPTLFFHRSLVTPERSSDT